MGNHEHIRYFLHLSPIWRNVSLWAQDSGKGCKILGLKQSSSTEMKGLKPRKGGGVGEKKWWRSRCSQLIRSKGGEESWGAIRFPLSLLDLWDGKGIVPKTLNAGATRESRPKTKKGMMRGRRGSNTDPRYDAMWEKSGPKSATTLRKKGRDKLGRSLSEKIPQNRRGLGSRGKRGRTRDKIKGNTNRVREIEQTGRERMVHTAAE